MTVCHAYGCKAQTRFAFTESDIAELTALMARVPREDTPAEERRALAYAIAWMERRVAPAVGTASDRTSIDLRGSGDPTQLDCVDEATNTTSYLLVLDRHGLLKHHAVDRPLAKDSLTRWTHWAAVIREKQSGARFAIDFGHRPQWRKPDDAGRGKLLCSGQLRGQRAAGERARHGGGDQRCAGARSRWAHAHARAHAGLGLCGRAYGRGALISAGCVRS